jgi:hypothetical protein
MATTWWIGFHPGNGSIGSARASAAIKPRTRAQGGCNPPAGAAYAPVPFNSDACEPIKFRPHKIRHKDEAAGCIALRTEILMAGGVEQVEGEPLMLERGGGGKSERSTRGLLYYLN